MDTILAEKIKRAKSVRAAEDAACALILQSGAPKVYFERGVKPLTEALSRGELCGAVLCDKVVGKAAAMLAALGGVSALHALLISRPAKAVLDRAGIPYTFDRECARIVNRRGDGLCPMESAVMEITDPADAPARIEQALKALRERKEKEEQTI